ncbi:MAG: hypothetical protein AB3N20_05130 [Rhizobiaceae bacterium]
MENQTKYWTTSRKLGNKTEIAICAPIKLGRVPNERRTFEERVRFKIDQLMQSAQQGLPTELSRITTIHFARMIVIRPEQYLIYSGLPGFPKPGEPGSEGPRYGFRNMIPGYEETTWAFDEFDDMPQKKDGATPEFRSWLLTQVIFDGDIKVYFRDIAEFIHDRFDDVFFNCEDFPGTGDFEAYWRWIRRYQIPNDLFLSVYPDLSVPRIKYLESFKRRFDAFVAQVRSPTGERLQPMDELFDEFLRQNEQFGSGFPAPGGVYVAAASEEEEES